MLERELGGGGMSRVFVARDVELARDVVVKVLAPELAEALSAERFAREIQLAAALQQANIVPVLRAGSSDGLPFYVMPFVEGLSLRERLARGRMPLTEVLSVLRDVARALEFAHGRGVVHRDIKPENILLSGATAVVTDFGIAKAVIGSTPRATGGTLTQVGASIGTPAYMAPEQALGAVVDHRVDIYAWGVVAWELLAGRHPFADKSTAQQLVAAHVTEAPLSLGTVAPATPTALVALVSRYLAKLPAERPASAAEAVRELEAIGASLSDRSFAASGARGSRPSRTFIVAAGFVAVVALIAALTSGITRRRASATPIEAARDDGSIAVLPLETVGGTATDAAYLGDGISEEIATALTSQPGLHVAARTSASAARGLSVLDIGRTLGVARVLQGTVQRVGERLRVRVQLVDASTDRALWSEHFDRDTKDIFALQDEIAREIATRVRPASASVASGALARSGTVDPEAHDLYLQGLYHFNRRGQSMYRAADLLERAVKRDPAYARAHALLALTYALLPSWGGTPAGTWFSRAVLESDRASALADAFVARAHVHDRRWDNGVAEPAYRRALALEPSNAGALTQYANFLARFRHRTADALRLLQQAVDLDPLSLPGRINLARAFYQTGRYADALAQLDGVASLDSTYGTLRVLRPAVLQQMGRSHEAAREFAASAAAEKSAAPRTRLLLMAATADAAAGDSSAARAQLAAFVASDARGAVTDASADVDIFAAMLASALGDHVHATRWLTRDVERLGSGFVRLTPHDPRLDALRRDP